jgi:hypothetical protein
MKRLIYWESDPPDTDAEVEWIDHFDARGMRNVYGRGDHFDRRLTFHMDIWMTRNRRLLMRCWSRCGDTDWRSFEIKGVDTSRIPKPHKKEGLQGSWVPEAARKAYSEWIEDES